MARRQQQADNMKPKWMLLVWTLSATMTLIGRPAVCARLPDIHWNSSNPIFRIDNTDHIFDVNKKQHDHDQVDLVCPQQSADLSNRSVVANSSDPNAKELERYIIYSVSKEEYDTCRVNGNGRVVAVCDQREGKRPAPFTVTFRSFTPQPNGLEFKAGQDYYFITALIGQSDPQRRFSPCREQNMKVIFKVCCKSTVTTSRPSASLLLGRPISPAPPTSRRPPVMTLRPSLAGKAAPASQPLDDYLRTLTAGQPPQPITVLPIEVLQPSTDSPSSSPPPPPPPPPPQSPISPPSDVANDIVQNDPGQPAGTQTRPAQRDQPLLPFDPTAPPESLKNPLYGRYPPTPLPPGLVKPARQPVREPHWQLPPLSRPPYQRAPAEQQPMLSQSGQVRSPSRLSFYPHTVWSTYEQPSGVQRELISVLEQQPQQNGAASSATLSQRPIGLLVLLLPALGLLLWLRSELLARRRARRAAQSAPF